MAGLTREEYDQAAKEIRDGWSRANSKDAGLQVIIDFGRKYGYKNVMAALQNRVPKQFEREKSVSSWIDEQKAAEDGGE